MPFDLSLIDSETLKKAESIEMLVLDVDGVMTNGHVYFSAQGDELKAFNILDGQGIKMLQNNGVSVAIITGRTSPLTARRARDLGIEQILQGREDKKVALLELIEDSGIGLDKISYLGDDLPDLSAIMSVGLGMTVPNAAPIIKKHAKYCTQTPGGSGAVREAAELILSAKGLLDDIHKRYMA